MINSTLPSYTLPCNCFICCLGCLKAYLDFFYRSNANKKKYFCLCSTYFDNFYLKTLTELCHLNNLKKFKKKSIEIYKERIKKQCMLCQQETEPNGEFKSNCEYLIVCELRDEFVEKVLLIKNFIHIICPDCWIQNGPPVALNTSIAPITQKTKSQYCLICNSLHTFIKFSAQKPGKNFDNNCLFI